MEPIYENIQPNIGSSFFMCSTSPGCCEPFWHIHPEYELVYIHSGSTERHIGSNVSRYKDGDLMLIGSNIPHSNLGNRDKNDNREIVIQLSDDFIQQRIIPFPEFKSITHLFERSKQGISFGAAVKKSIGELLLEMDKLPAFDKLLVLLQVLQKMAKTKDYVLLNADSAILEVQSNDYARVNLINCFVADNFHRNIQLAELGELTGLTVTSFSRFFKKVTGKTFISFLNEYRIQKSCTFLADKNTSIAEVMALAGFFEAAHFARIFKRYTSYSPRDYRKRIRNW